MVDESDSFYVYELDSDGNIKGEDVYKGDTCREFSCNWLFRMYNLKVYLSGCGKKALVIEDGPKLKLKKIHGM